MVFDYAQTDIRNEFYLILTGSYYLFFCGDLRDQRERTWEDLQSKNNSTSIMLSIQKNRINAKPDPDPIFPLVL